MERKGKQKTIKNLIGENKREKGKRVQIKMDYVVEVCFQKCDFRKWSTLPTSKVVTQLNIISVSLYKFLLPWQISIIFIVSVSTIIMIVVIRRKDTKQNILYVGNLFLLYFPADPGVALLLSFT